MKRVFFVFIAVCLTAVCSGCGFIYEREYYKGFDIVFGTDLSISAELLGRKAPKAFKAMVAECQEIDSQVSLTRPDSDLSKLNAAAAGESVAVGKHTFALWERAKEFFSTTGGFFNPQLSGLSALWRVDASFGGNFKKTVLSPALPDYDGEIKPFLASADFSQFLTDGYEEDGKYYLKKQTGPAALDFGAIAKGYAADRCIEIAKEYGITSAIVDLAGNIKTLGKVEDKDGGESPFPVSVGDPRPQGVRGSQARERLIVFAADESEWSVSVSGDYQRFYYFSYGEGEEDIIPVCHILNPFSGMPLGVTHDGNRYRYDFENAVIAAAVINQNSALSDAYSTAVSVMGYEDGKAFLKREKICGVMMTERRIAFVGIAQSDFYKPDEYGTLSKYGANIEYIGF